MATITDIPDLDSGVASPEAVGEGQFLIIKSPDKSKPNVMPSNSSKNEDSKEVELVATVVLSDSKNENSDKTISKLAESDIGIDDDDENNDESLAERIWGLTEMFPESIRSTTSVATEKTISIIKSTYQLTRQVLWIGISTSILLFAPVMFEVERYNVEEMVKQDRNRLVLGPGSALSGPPGSPTLPPPPAH